MTWAEARSAGVFRAAMHSGSQRKRALARWNSVPVEPRRHGDVRLDAKARGLQALHEPDCGPLLAPVEAFGEQQGESGMKRCRQARCAHQELAGELEAQRRASQQGIRIGTDGAHQAQGFAVGADQDVLPVVHGEAVDLHGFGRVRRVCATPRKPRPVCLRRSVRQRQKARRIPPR
jgi:hypothetical protein